MTGATSSALRARQKAKKRPPLVRAEAVAVVVGAQREVVGLVAVDGHEVRSPGRRRRGFFKVGLGDRSHPPQVGLDVR
jgi:hypothetical protein